MGACIGPATRLGAKQNRGGTVKGKNPFIFNMNCFFFFGTVSALVSACAQRTTFLQTLWEEVYSVTACRLEDKEDEGGHSERLFKLKQVRVRKYTYHLETDSVGQRKFTYLNFRICL